MPLILFVVVVVAFTLLPVMVGARVVGARRSDSWSVLLAVIALAALSRAVDHWVASAPLAFALSLVLGTLLLAGILGTSVWRALAVAAIALALQALGLLLLAGVLGGAQHGAVAALALR